MASVLTENGDMMAAELQALRSLSRRLQVAAEEERARIARQVHDTLAQELAALTLDLHDVVMDLPVENEDLRVRLDRMQQSIGLASAAVRKLINELRPGVLDHFGLAAAIEWQTQEFGKRTGIACQVSGLEQSVTVPRDRATAVYRAFEEALTNVSRHARATRIEVSLEQREGLLLLSLLDNGVGIEEGQASSSSSLGLIAMRERIRHVGGEVDVRGAPREGTRVQITIPLLTP